MSLLDLPPELLIRIFEYVGAANFHSDVSRITVNKQWSKFAHTAFLQDLCLTQKTLRGLVASPCLQAGAHPFTDTLRSVSLNLIGFDDWSLLDQDTYSYPRLPWEAKLEEDLDFLTTITSNSRKLRSISIRATEEPCIACPGPPRQDYLYVSTIRSVLSATNLTHLDLDLVGSSLISFRDHYPPWDRDGTHICPHIAAHLATLQSLRLRLRDICPTVLSPPQGSTKLRLKNVLINLSLDNEAGGSIYDWVARPCGRGPGVVYPTEEAAAIERQAQTLVRHMAAPEMVRVLSASRAYHHINAFDALTGQTIKLSNAASKNACWDTDEEFVERKPEIELESEVEPDDLSDFDFDGDDIKDKPNSDADDVSDFWDFDSDGDDGPS